MTNEKWYVPSEVHSGWHKTMSPAKRRQLVLEAHKGDNLAAARSMQETSNVTQDQQTKRLMRADALYFYKEYHKEKDRQTRNERRPNPDMGRSVTPRITAMTPRLR